MPPITTLPQQISNPSSSTASTSMTTAVTTTNHQSGQNHTSDMLCEPSEDKSSMSSINGNNMLNHNVIASNNNNTARQQQAIGPLPSSHHNLLANPLMPAANATANLTQAQLVQAIQQQQQQQQQQLQMQLQLQLQQAAAHQPFAQQHAQQQQQQQLMAHLIANAASSTPHAASNPAAALQAALLLQQQQQQQRQQQLEYLARSAAAAAAQIPHNLIPKHLQASSLAASLDGTPGYQPALILPPTASTNTTSLMTGTAATTANNGATATATAKLPPPFPLTVQDEILSSITSGYNKTTMILPPIIYNGVNLQYPGLRQLHANPPVYVVDNFLTPQECQFLIRAASDVFQPAPVVGKGIGELSASRTSSTCYLAREDLPDYLRKVNLLTGKPIKHCELPQVGRYLPSQHYLQHFDAFDLGDENGRRFAANGGQRVVTVLVYLNTLTQEEGGATRFPNLGFQVQPVQGMALVFFPSTVDGLLDQQALHAALPPCSQKTKYVSQVWIRQSDYKGDASKRLNPIMGIPNYEPPTMMEALQLKAAAAAAATGGSGLT